MVDQVTEEKNEAKKQEKKEAKKDKKKKKSKTGILLILLLLLLLLGLGLNFGFGGIGGLLPGSTAVSPVQQQQAQEEQKPEQPTPETKALGTAEKAGPYVIAVGENGITLDGEAVTIEKLTEAVNNLPEGAEVVLKDEHAVVADYSGVKAILDAAGLSYSEEK